jgi:hypothetical protein
MGLLDDFAKQVGWTLSLTNVIVEGTSDAALFRRASELHNRTFGVPIIDGSFRICAAGRGDDGGVEGVNRMLVTAYQLAAADRHPNGRPRYRFVGLLDNDPAGRRGIRRLTSFTSRIQEAQDIFLLYPDMPLCDGRGMPHVRQRLRQLRDSFGDSRFEIEDLMAPSFLTRFEQSTPDAIIKKEPLGPRFHYHFSERGKVAFRKHALSEGSAEDYAGFFAVAKALRSYLGVDHSGIGPRP